MEGAITHGANRGKFAIFLARRLAMIGAPTGWSAMALQLRPNCEYCDKDLPPTALDARICSYECTFCADCVETKLFNVCPNCGGGFSPRPIRPSREWRTGVCAVKQVPSEKRVHLKYPREEVAAHSARIKAVPPEGR